MLIRLDFLATKKPALADLAEVLVTSEALTRS